MDSKSAIFVAVGSLLVMAIYSPIMNFVSAETVSHCFTIGERYICYYVFDVVKPPAIAVANCDSQGTNCQITWVQQAVETPDVKDAIKNAQIANFGRELSPDVAENSADDTDPTSNEPLKIPPKLEMPNLK